MFDYIRYNTWFYYHFYIEKERKNMSNSDKEKLFVDDSQN
jgi:hypothetical protein